MGGKCCTTLVNGSIPVVKEATQALASDYSLHEAGPTLLPRACWCADLNRDENSKPLKQVLVSGSVTPEDQHTTIKAFSSEHRQSSTSSLCSRFTENPGDIDAQCARIAAQAPAQEIKGRAERAGEELHRQGSGVDYESMSEDEKHREAKRIIKDFVTSMVKGKEITVVSPSGVFMDCLLGLTRELETLKIKPKLPRDAHARRIPLHKVDEILVGTDTGYSQMETPLDDFCVTLVLSSSDCVTFRESDVEMRDTLAACLTLFCNSVRGVVPNRSAD